MTEQHHLGRLEGKILKIGIHRNARFMICEKDLGYQTKETDIGGSDLYESQETLVS